MCNRSVKYRLPEQLRLHRAQSITLRASVNVQGAPPRPFFFSLSAAHSSQLFSPADVFEVISLPPRPYHADPCPRRARAQSYIGGLYQDQGLVAVQDWLRALLRPYVHEAYRIVRSQHGLPPASATSGAPAGPLPAPRRLSDPALPVSPPPSPSLTSATIGHLGLFNQRLQQDNRTIEWSFSDSKDQGTKATPVWVARALVDRECWGTGRGNTKKAAKNEAAKQGLSKIGYTVRVRVTASVAVASSCANARGFCIDRQDLPMDA